MELDPTQYPAKVTTTAEAIWALAALPDRIRAKTLVEQLGSVDDELAKLWAGLEELVAASRQQQELNARHLAWCLLAATSWQRHKSDGTIKVTDAASELLRLVRQPDGIWPDDPERDHEIYATWLCTWSLLQACAFLSQAPGNVAASAVRGQALEAVKKSLDWFKRVADAPEFRGFAFSAQHGTAKQPGELEPNPAMTAYVLSLLGEAQHLLPDLDLSLAIDATVAALLSGNDDVPPSVWDSYREPQIPGSKDSDFEHFTTCWVARALWLALSTSRGPVHQRKVWFRSLSRAIKGLVVELHAQTPGGLFYVDIGAPRDFSFAVSDALGLFNSLAYWQIHFEGDEDAKLSRMIQLGQIEEDFDNATREKEIFDRYSGLRGMVATLENELEENRQELAELARQREEEDSLMIRRQSEFEERKAQQESALAEINILLNSAQQDVESVEEGIPFRWIWLGRPITVFDLVATGAALIGTAIIVALHVQVESFVKQDNLTTIVAGTLLVIAIGGSAFFSGAALHEAFRRSRRIRRGPFGLAVVWFVSGVFLQWKFLRLVVPDLNPSTFFEVIALPLSWSPLYLGWKISAISAKILASGAKRRATQ